MRKMRIAALLLGFVLLFTAFPVFAEEIKGLENGSFEAGGDTPEGWSAPQKGFELTTENVQDGKRAAHLFGETANMLTRTVIGLKAGEKYTLTGYMKASEGAGAAWKVEFSGITTEGDRVSFSEGDKHVNLEASKEWKQVTLEFEAPKGATRATIMLRKLRSGDVYWDNISLKGALTAEVAIVPDPPLSEQDRGKPNPQPDTPVAENELLLNPGFEQVSSQLTPSLWSLSGGTWNKDAIADNVSPRGGKYGMLFTGAKAMYVGQTLLGAVPGEKYNFSGFVKADPSTLPAIKIVFKKTNAEGKTVEMEKPVEMNVTTCTEAAYSKVTIPFTMPADAESTVILVRKLRAGTVLWDDVSITGKIDVKVKEPIPSQYVQKVPDGSKNILKNNSFEAIDTVGGGPSDWECYGGAWTGGMVTAETGNAMDGDRYISISTATGGYPWARQIIHGVEPGETYQATAWLQTFGVSGSGFAFKVEYAGEGVETTETLGRYQGGGQGVWKQVVQTFTIPKNTEYIRLYVRLYGTGTALVDNVELHKIGEKGKYDLSNDWVFYYPEWLAPGAVGTATLQNSLYSDEKAERTVTFRFKDGASVLKEETVRTENAVAKFIWPLSFLQEKYHEYTIEAVVMDDAGAVLETRTQPIWVYDRPTKLNEKGEYINEDGSVFNPVISYHHPTSNFKEAAEAGINLLQGYKAYADWNTVLDEANKYGIKIMFPLYTNMQPASSIYNIEKTKETILAYKDHPAVFGWMVMDEPYFILNDPEDDLYTSYKLLRDLDPDHPVYICEAEADHYVDSGKYCDVLCVDPYYADKPMEHFVSNRVRIAQEATGYRRPVYSLLQAFEYGKEIPTAEDMRHTLYQSFFEGAKGVGYYCFENSVGKSNLNDTDMWKGIVSFKENEMEDAFAYFAQGKYPTFVQYRSDDVWYQGFVKDNKIHLIVLNQSSKAHSAEIPLVSLDGRVRIDGFTASLLSEDGKTSGNGTLSVSLGVGDVQAWVITPDTAVDFSGLTNSPLIDIENHAWARNAIEALYTDGIVNTRTPVAYGPDIKITRGDFAMFLIRTLGLSSDATELFGDVDPAAPYAKEIAIGKALGILKGVGDGTYRPETEISRQDLMVICARGMKLLKELPAGAGTAFFTDAEKIADYAAADISSMVELGIVKGYEDGTVRPLGNTTRAEAAVIMSRIQNWN